MKLPPRLLLVGWEAADWSILQPLLDAGEMPELRRVVENGVSGMLLSTRPFVPAAQWTSLATGKRPWQHRVCHEFEQPTDGNELVAITARQRRSLAVWDILGKSEKRSLVVGWPATHGAHPGNAVIVSDRYAQPTAKAGVRPWPPAPSGTYCPEKTADALNRQRVSPEDVLADVISRYIPDWKKVDQKRDRRLGLLRVVLATDSSHFNAINTLLADGAWNFAAVHLPALGAISQMFLPFRAPRPDGISEAEFGLYQHALRAACLALDRMLGLLVQAAGPGVSVLVVSTHGVSRRAPPSANLLSQNRDAWKSPHGIFAAAGPTFACKASIVGATVLDVTPTVLNWFGLPIGDDMEGRVLIESFAKAPEVRRIATWEPQPVGGQSAGPAVGEAEVSFTATALRRETEWNLAQSFLDASRHAEALPVLDRLFHAFPERMELAQALFHCQITLERLPNAAETLEVLLEKLPAGVWPILARAELCLARKETKEARSFANQAWALHPNHPEALRRLGLLLLRLREWNTLAELARRAISLDENLPLAWIGLGEAQLRRRLPVEAEQAALRAIRLNYFLPDAHFIMARAQIAQGKWRQARESLLALNRMQPNNRAAAAYFRRAIQAGA